VFPPLLPLSCMHSLAPSRTSKAWASLRCVDAGVTPRSLDTSLLAVALRKVYLWTKVGVILGHNLGDTSQRRHGHRDLYVRV